MIRFIDFLTNSWKKQNSLLCVGLDPAIEKLPVSIRKQQYPLLAFNREIIDATARWVCAFKPQVAYYSALGAETQLHRTIEYIKTNYPHIPVILDAKRGDIGATASMYAREAFDRYQADAVTVNPFMGGDTLKPFLDYADKGIFIVCRTSNPASGDFQQLESGGKTVAQHIATRAAEEWNEHANVGLVIGATFPNEIGKIRKLVGDIPLLIPGIGAQGGDLEATLTNGLTVDCTGLLINVSRGVLYAGSGSSQFSSAATAAEMFCRDINRHRKQTSV